MATEEQIRWDEQHRSSPNAQPPSALLRELVESDAWPALGGTALDIASGKGRNAIYLAQRGFAVTALDISAVALTEGRRRAQSLGLTIDWRQSDLEANSLDLGEFDLIINFNYLQRSLFRSIRQAVKPGGHVIFETYLVDQAAVGHPKNPAYLLQPNELLDNFRDFRILFYREGRSGNGAAPAFRAGMFAQRIS